MDNKRDILFIKRRLKRMMLCPTKACIYCNADYKQIIEKLEGTLKPTEIKYDCSSCGETVLSNQKHDLEDCKKYRSASKHRGKNNG